MIPTTERFANELDTDSETRHTVHRVLKRVEDAIREIGYRAFVDDLVSNEFIGGVDSPVGSSAVNVIPGPKSSSCCSVVLAVSQGIKGPIGFPKVMQQLRRHLIHCMPKTRVAIVLCDHWSPDLIEDQIGDLLAHYEQGVRFLFLLAGVPNDHVAPVAVDFGAVATTTNSGPMAADG